jgi:hypothetical protein
MAERTWADAIGEFLQSARRHKVISAIVVLCVAGSLAGIGLASSASGQAAPAPEAAAPFSLPELGHAGNNARTLRERPPLALFHDHGQKWADSARNWP